jgi:alcohol dehydrogenase (cytochrome c)
VKWEYKRKYPEGVNGGTNRNMAMWGNTIIDAGADNSLYAVDARTGNLAWETQILKAGVRANASSGPIIANGKVITGRQCQPDATNNSVRDHRARRADGQGDLADLHDSASGEPGYDTWGDVPMEQRWHVGTWMVPSYDPETNMIFVGTSVTIPAPKFTLGGADKQHLYHNSTLALDADTGKIVWYYQHIIDEWDLDHPFERLLVETAIAPDKNEVAWINPRIKPGERRKVITGIPGKTGIVYTLDRKTGEFLWAGRRCFRTSVSKIDGATAR